MKIILLHGWDWKKYPVFAPQHQWENRQAFVDGLLARYQVDYPTMPGFDHEEVDRIGSWTLDDYAHWLEEQVATHHYDAVIGYSFGAAVATRWQRTFGHREVELFLISPAIIRSYSVHQSKALGYIMAIAKHFMLPTSVVRWLRLLYLIHWVKNPFVLHGSAFLRETYSNIVGLDLTDDIRALLQNGTRLICVFGAMDTTTPYDVLVERVPEVSEATHVIQGGTHDIGNTHYREVVEQIIARLKEHGGDLWK